MVALIVVRKVDGHVLKKIHQFAQLLLVEMD